MAENDAIPGQSLPGAFLPGGQESVVDITVTPSLITAAYSMFTPAFSSDYTYFPSLQTVSFGMLNPIINTGNSVSQYSMLVGIGS